MSSARWRVSTTTAFDRDLRKLDREVQRRIVAYLEELERLDDPRQRGKGLTADHAGIWRYRVGDYRILTRIDDVAVTVLALRVGHRSTVY